MRTAYLLAATIPLLACGSENPSTPPVLTVTLTAPKQTIAVGEPLQLMATARDVNGVTLPGAKVSYTVSATNVVTVSPSGLAVGLVPGSASITATSDGRTSSPVTLTVVAGSVAAVFTTQGNTFSPPQISIRAQQSVAFALVAGQPHNVTFRDRPQHPGAPTDIPSTANDVVTRAFPTAGTFPFDCTLHSGMSAQVVVTP
jgi:plastocyanin